MQRALGSVLAVVLLAVASPALACSCVEVPVPAARSAATWVFEGVMLRGSPTGEAERQRATFRVERVWKGTLAEEVTIDIPTAGSMCPPNLTVGERVILYVSGTPEAPRVEGCARYAVSSQLRAERRALGRPQRRARQSRR